MTVDEVVALPGRLLRLPNYYHSKFSTLDYCQVVETRDGELLVKFDRLGDADRYHSLLEESQYADYAELASHLPLSILPLNPRLINFGVVRLEEPNKAAIHGVVRYRSPIFTSNNGSNERRQFLEFEDIDDAVYTVSSSPQITSLQIPSQLERELLFNLPNLSNNSNPNNTSLNSNNNRNGTCTTFEGRYYKIDLVRVEQGLDPRTTCMIRNIPNKYTQTMLIEWLNETHKGKYDFLYLRMDFRNRCNVGYAFINFIDYRSIASFVKRIEGKKWSRFNSDKVCAVSYARIQGKEALISKFKHSRVMQQEPEYRPKTFYSSGPLKGQEEEFPQYSPNNNNN